MPGSYTNADGMRRLLLDVFQFALTAVNGRVLVKKYLDANPLQGAVYLIAVGKAACAMARGAHEALRGQIRRALIVTKRGYAEAMPWPVWETGHPLPDAASLAAGDQLFRFVAAMPQDARVVVLLSGGASALIERLPDAVTLDHLRALNEWLLASGRDISAMNRIRKRLSRIKGGRLAQLLAPRTVLGLAISDVPGDDPASIGSGPLVPDPDAKAQLDLSGAPETVRQALRHASLEPIAAGCFRRVHLEIIATLDDAKRAAAAAARRQGFRAAVVPGFVRGEAVRAGERLAAELVQSEAGVVYVWGGETTVTLPPTPGRGGRNQTLALAAALVLKGQPRTLFLAAGTDGTDGPTEDAGALVDGETIARGEMLGFDVRGALARADAGSFLAASGDLIQTGPTGTNVMDLMLGLRLPPGGEKVV